MQTGAGIPTNNTGTSEKEQTGHEIHSTLQNPNTLSSSAGVNSGNSYEKLLETRPRYMHSENLFRLLRNLSASQTCLCDSKCEGETIHDDWADFFE